MNKNLIKGWRYRGINESEVLKSGGEVVLFLNFFDEGIYPGLNINKC